MNTKYNRDDYLNIEVVDGIPERDYLMSNWELFVQKRPMAVRALTASAIQRPDSVSLTIYGRSDYWWIISKCNPEIQDWWNDVYIGRVIMVPDADDIKDFYLACRNKIKTNTGT